MIKRLFGVVLIAVSVSACTTVSHVPLSKEMSNQLRDKSVAATQYTTPDFVAFTAGKAAFAVVGAAIMISEGNEIIKENEIEDPAIKIAQGLAAKLEEARAMKMLVPKAMATVTKDDVPTLLSTYPGTDYLIDVKTFAWMFNYYPTDWAHYKVTYNARFRLIEASTQKVVSETLCRTVQGDDSNPPTKDQLLDNGAKLLKEYFGKSVSMCVDLLSKELLML